MMGRPPRALIAGGIYHVYNRVARGAHIFRDEAEAEKFEALVAATKQRDDFQILAWLGATLYGFKVKEIAAGFDKYGETASRLVSRAAQRRMDEVGFADRVRGVDSAITKAAARVAKR